MRRPAPVRCPTGRPRRCSPRSSRAPTPTAEQTRRANSAPPTREGSLASVSTVNPALLTELEDWMRIPSVSTGGGEAEDLLRAASWVVERVRGAGGEADVVQIGDGNPLAVGELRGGDPSAATLLIYGQCEVTV